MYIYIYNHEIGRLERFTPDFQFQSKTSPGSRVVRPHWKPRKERGTPRMPIQWDLQQVTDCLHGYHMVTIWLPYGYHMVTI